MGPHLLPGFKRDHSADYRLARLTDGTKTLLPDLYLPVHGEFTILRRSANPGHSIAIPRNSGRWRRWSPTDGPSNPSRYISSRKKGVGVFCVRCNCHMRSVDRTNSGRLDHG